MGKYDILDSIGNKVGELRPSQSTDATGLLILILIFLPIIIIGAIIEGILTGIDYIGDRVFIDRYISVLETYAYSLHADAMYGSTELWTLHYKVENRSNVSRDASVGVHINIGFSACGDDKTLVFGGCRTDLYSCWGNGAIDFGRPIGADQPWDKRAIWIEPSNLSNAWRTLEGGEPMEIKLPVGISEGFIIPLQPMYRSDYKELIDACGSPQIGATELKILRVD